MQKQNIKQKIIIFSAFLMAGVLSVGGAIKVMENQEDDSVKVNSQVSEKNVSLAGQQKTNQVLSNYTQQVMFSETQKLGNKIKEKTVDENEAISIKLAGLEPNCFEKPKDEDDYFDLNVALPQCTKDKLLAVLRKIEGNMLNSRSTSTFYIYRELIEGVIIKKETSQEEIAEVKQLVDMLTPIENQLQKQEYQEWLNTLNSTCQAYKGLPEGGAACNTMEQIQEDIQDIDTGKYHGILARSFNDAYEYRKAKYN